MQSEATIEQTPPADRAPKRRSAPAFVKWLPIVLFFGSYPLAFICPMGVQASLVFRISVPSMFWLSLMAVVCLLLSPLRNVGAAAHGEDASPDYWDPRRRVQALLLLFALICVASAILGHTAESMSVVEQIGYVAIPVFFAVCSRRLIPRNLPRILAILWVLQILHGIWQVTVANHQIVGLAGNQNWAATLATALVPWVWLTISSRRFKTEWLRKALPAWGLVAITAGISLVVLVHCKSRGTWLVLAVYVVLFIVRPRISRALSAILIIAAGMTALAVFVYFPDKAARTIESDIRLPMYASSVRLAAGHPLLGVGPGNFRRDFTRYRSVAHKSRVVAAAVTAHPHNEILHVASNVGVVGVVLWMLLLVPLLRSPRPTGFWRCVHFSAFMIVGHSFLDKVLVQPPTNLLAFYLLGILWRPHLRVRQYAGHVAPKGTRLLLRWAVVAAATIYALNVGVRYTLNTHLFRQAYLLEDEGRCQEAYNAYRRSTEIRPGDVRTHAFAGIISNNKLHSPKTALPHLLAAHDLEPNFAHINGEIGLALGATKKHVEALPYFQREAQLYPFDILPHQRLFLCGLATGRVPNMLQLYERLALLHVRELTNAIGTEEARAHAAKLRNALLKGNTSEALAIAMYLVSKTGVPPGTSEPAFFRIGVPMGLPRNLYTRAFNDMHSRYWSRLTQHRQRVRQLAPVTPETVLSNWTFPPAGDKNALAAYWGFAEFAHQAGLEVGLVRLKDGTQLPLLEIHGAGKAWLVQPHTGQSMPGKTVLDLQQDESLRKRLGLPDTLNTEGLLVSLPISPLEHFTTNQTLGQILRQMLGSVAPVFWESPELRRRSFILLLANTFYTPKGGNTNHQAHPQEKLQLPVSVDFDERVFRALAEELSRQETDAPATNSATQTPKP